jgi:phage terminase large subunit-like protein
MQNGWSRPEIGKEWVEAILAEWFGLALAQQYFPGGSGDNRLITGGRGSGKTRVGAEWVNGLVRGFPPFTTRGRRYGRIALVGESLGDVREVMIEGPSGIRAVSRGVPPRFEATRRRLVWEATGAVAQIFSSEDPESLRGPQFDAAWLDEAAKWKNAEATFDMLQFGLRLGERPIQIVTTTPRPTRLMKRLITDPTVRVSRLSTQSNSNNLAAGFIAALERRYGGTRLARQELDGELIEDREDALWSRAALEAMSGGVPADLRRIVVAVDPPASSGRASAACGIVAAGLDGEGNGIVLADATVEAARPTDWAAAAIRLYRRVDADCIVAEVNQGGDMVTAVLRTVDATVPVKAVRANRGKWLRAEPVAALYHQGRARHAERFPALEDEMCDFGPDGLAGGRSPDRVDALVWALTELMLGRGGEPRVRGLG